MLKRCMLSMLLAFVLVVGFCSASFADTMPPVPVMTLTVTQSMSDIYPPMMVYTCQLASVPVNGLVVDFYNSSVTSSGTLYTLIGSAPVDSKGKAVLNKQMLPGTYSAYAQMSILGTTYKSNVVNYIVK